MTKEEIIKLAPRARVFENEPMKAHTTFKIGGPAKLFVMPSSADEVKIIVGALKENDEKFIVIGRGSNILVSDAGYDGTVICLGESLASVKVDGERIEAEAGAPLIGLSVLARDEGLSGLEFAAGIPGSLGGGVYMNAGAHGGEMSNVIESVTVIDRAGEMHTFAKDELNLSYRSSRIMNEDMIVVSAVLKLVRGDRAEIESKMNEFLALRKAAQPIEYPSAGSTFKRPEGAFAGKLIDEAGLGGYSIGDAEVSDKHCGMIINKGNATAKDVMALCDYVKKVVYEKNGIMLEMEVEVIGDI